MALTDFSKELNREQREAVEFGEGPLLILAGAGSGKTRALTYRAAHLMAKRGVGPEHILLTTFTNKAAGEMQDRLEGLVGYRLPFAGTFHSLCARLLRLHGHEVGLSREYVIFDTADSIGAIKQVMKELKISVKEYKPRALLGTIEQAKHNIIGWEEYADFARGPYQLQVARVYKKYQMLLAECNAVDFNDLLLKMLKLLQTSDRVRSRYQGQFEYALVDEYQDTNQAQYQLTKLFAAPQNNLCVVGDASQAIYSWRGADYKNLMLLQQDFPDLTTIKLEQNYRSTKTILKAADDVIAHNTLHPVLELWSEGETGEKIRLFEAEDEYDEIRYVVSEIERAKNSSFDDFVILYRTNAQSRVIEEALVRRGIPYQLIGGVKFYERKEIKDVLAYVRYAYNPQDVISLERMEKLGKRRLRAFMNWLEKKPGEIKTIDMLDEILAVTDYLSKYNPEDLEDAGRIENVQELRSVAQQFDDVGDFLENVALVERESNSGLSEEIADTGAVSLMTLHASKGLEFKQVFMIGMEEGLFPHSRALMSKEELEEERRLCYVGITRAEERLSLSYARTRLYFGSRSQNNVSRFLGELPDEVVVSAGGMGLGRPQKSRVSSPIDGETLDKFLNDEIDINEFLNS